MHAKDMAPKNSNVDENKFQSKMETDFARSVSGMHNTIVYYAFKVTYIIHHVCPFIR